MQYYFPYCHILEQSVSQAVSKHAYIGDWQVYTAMAVTATQSQSAEISELYY
ncbi:MAG: hypothetical protein NC342_09005 [Pseudoflavonifractor sp.]|nr:hypothetical protein [Alloprevotella sp.]MCM1117659.1 hypothetical protein [Pseudoflavonifractor sp.]